MIMEESMEIISSTVEEFVKKQKAQRRKATMLSTSNGVKCLIVQTVPMHIFRAYIVEDNSLIEAGVLTVSHLDDVKDIELSTVKVEEEFRHQGIGSLLVKRAVTTAYFEGYDAIKLTSFKSTMGFFEQYGFRATDGQLNCLTTWPDKTLVTMELPLLVKHKSQQHSL